MNHAAAALLRQGYGGQVGRIIKCRASDVTKSGHAEAPG